MLNPVSGLPPATSSSLNPVHCAYLFFFFLYSLPHCGSISFSVTAAPEACFTHAGAVMLCQAFSALLIWLPLVSTGTYKFKTSVRSANRQLIATLVTGHVCRAKTSWPQQRLISDPAMFSLQPLIASSQDQSSTTNVKLWLCPGALHLCVKLMQKS